MNPATDRCLGIFVPLFALRGNDDQGIGDTRALREMIDWCADRGIAVLQILPVNETSGDNSPYNAVSSVALEPSTLSLRPGDLPGMDDALRAEVLSRHDLSALRGESVDYVKLRAFIRDVGFNAMDRLDEGAKRELQEFIEREAGWIHDYTWFRALMEWNGNSPVWDKWAEAHRSPAAACRWRSSLDAESATRFDRLLNYYAFMQWALDLQWSEVARYAAARGVGLMGDMPFGVSRHSADVWAQPDQFDLGRSGGAPREPFFQGDDFIRRWGQNWGIPPYRWDRMEADGFRWWRRRVAALCRYFRVFRIDHVLGFYRLYSFPWTPEHNGRFVDLDPEEVRAECGDVPRFLPFDDETPEGAEANRQQGERLLRMILDAADGAVVVGEDLGVVPDYVRPSLASLGISGFKIPVFERDEASQEFSPRAEYPVLSVVTLATHDHSTMLGLWKEWWASFERGREAGQGTDEWDRGERDSWELYRAQRFLGLPDATPLRDFEPTVREAWIRAILDAPSWLAILMITDLFGWDLRFNVPGPVADSNWSARLPVTVQGLANDPVCAGIASWLEREMRASGRLCAG